MRCLIASAVAVIAATLPAFADNYRQSVGVGVLELLNVKVSASATPAADPSTGPRTNRDYVDGYNRVDSSGNLGEGAPGLPSRTGNFGFVSNSQVDLQRGTLALHTLNPAGGRYFERSSRHGDPAPEVYYRLVRERAGGMAFGMEARVGRVDFDDVNTDDLAGAVRILTDTYALGGVVPQSAPYSGAFTVQPGTQRIGDVPTRSIATASAAIQGRREMSATGWLLRLGVIWQPVRTRGIDLEVHGGPALLNLKGEFNVNESWTSAGVPNLVQRAAGSNREWIVGGYVGGSLNVHLNARWDAVLGGDFLHADTLGVSSGGSRVRFDFSRGLLLNAGLALRF